MFGKSKTTAPTVSGPWEYKSDFKNHQDNPDIAREFEPTRYRSITALDVKQETDQFPAIHSNKIEKYKKLNGNSYLRGPSVPWHPLTANLYGRILRHEDYAFIQLADVKNHYEFYLEPTGPMRYGRIGLGSLDNNYIVMGLPTGLYRFQYHNKKLEALPFIPIKTKYNSVYYTNDEDKLMQIESLSADHLVLLSYSARHVNLFFIDTNKMKQDRFRTSKSIKSINKILTFPKDNEAKENASRYILTYSYAHNCTLFEVNFTWKMRWYARRGEFEIRENDSSRYISYLNSSYAILSTHDETTRTYFEFKKEDKTVSPYRLDKPSNHPIPFKETSYTCSFPKFKLFGDWLLQQPSFECTNIRESSYLYQLDVDHEDDYAGDEQVYQLSDDEIAVVRWARDLGMHVLTVFESPAYQFRKVDVFFKEIAPFISTSVAKITAQYAFCLFAQKTQQSESKIDQANKKIADEAKMREEMRLSS